MNNQDAPYSRDNPYIDPSSGDIRDPALKLKARAYGQAPVQADGVIDEFEFYFRARGSYWFFVVSLSADTPPDTWMEAEEDGYFTDEFGHGYALTGEYGPDFKASYMPFHDVERIICTCAEKFLSEQTSNQSRQQH
jgi:hypothetical protein